MVRGRFVWGSSKKHPVRIDGGIDQLWSIGLLLAALLLYFMNLGSLPLRDWDEGIVAQVAREIYRAPAGSQTWLYPTLSGEPYLNKPPLMHWLIAGAYAIGGVNEWTTRIPGALLTALSVPLLYAIGREIFARRSAAIFSALVYLTLMPVVRHGRLAMLDGAVVCFLLLTVWCSLRARRDLRWGLGAGVGLGLMCLTKGILGVLLGAIVGVFLLWDTPRLFTSLYLWVGIWLGCMPVLLWYGAQWLHYSQGLFTNLQEQSFNRIWTTVEGHSGPPWYYLVEILKYSLPWLIFLPQGFRFAWEHRNLSWAKLVLVWSASYLLIISLMGTKLPWYVLPIYPALALVLGAQFGEVWHTIYPGFLQAESRPYPHYWVVLLALVSVICWIGSAYFGWFSPKPELDVQLILISVAFTLTATAVLAYKHDFQFLLILFWGCYVSLGLFFNSNHWVWELAEAYPVKPIAQLIQKNTSAEQVIYTSYPYHRPSLNFYSDRRIIPASSAILQQQWQMTKPYLLVDAETLHALQLNQVETIGTAEKWLLVTRSSNSKLLPFTYTPASHLRQAPTLHSAHSDTSVMGVEGVGVPF